MASHFKASAVAAQAAHVLGAKSDIAVKKTASVKFCLVNLFFHSLFDADSLP